MNNLAARDPINSPRATRWLYLGMIGALIACLWVGWGDVEFNLPQEVLRHRIRSATRMVLQLCVQFVAPMVILSLLARDGMRYLQRRRGSGQ